MVTETTYFHHRITGAPRRWQSVGAALAQQGRVLAQQGGALYGAWRSQIGRPRDEVTAITAWSGQPDAAAAEAALLDGVPDVAAVATLGLAATLRPTDTAPPLRQGNYAFRWFLTPETDWSEFLRLCAEAWPGFEAAYDSQVVGLWRGTGAHTGPSEDPVTGPTAAGDVRSLLLTRRPSLAMWERSKLPQGSAETAVRETLSRRYDLCTWTAVHTTTLLTATDSEDQARWT
jgi:hypothetical protein